MRQCAKCNREDAPYFEQYPCNCGAAKAHDDDPRPDKHRADCNGIGHEVVQYPMRIDRRDLTFDAAGTPTLPTRYRQAGWQLQRNGAKFYRVKLLCRACIEGEELIMARKREYEKLCKAARGEETQTYAQMLASQ